MASMKPEFKKMYDKAVFLTQDVRSVPCATDKYSERNQDQRIPITTACKFLHEVHYGEKHYEHPVVA